MAVTAAMVKELREMTGAGMMDCKKALVEADGDMEKAVEILREKGLSKAAKKAGRIAAQGLVGIAFSDDASKASIIEVNSETDFVAKNEEFITFVDNLAKLTLESDAEDMDAFMALSYGDEGTVQDALNNKISKIGENMNIRRFQKIAEPGTVNVGYVHGGGTIGVIVKAESECADKDAVKAVLKNVALQIAAMNPKYLDKDSVPAADLEAEKEILMAQINNDEKNASKPEAVKEKMILGKIGKFYDTNCLLEQEYVKEDKVKVSAYVASEANKLGADIKITSFLRYEKGEGIEKREDNFAEEIAKLTQK